MYGLTDGCHGKVLLEYTFAYHLDKHDWSKGFAKPACRWFGSDIMICFRDKIRRWIRRYFLSAPRTPSCSVLTAPSFP